MQKPKGVFISREKPMVVKSQAKTGMRWIHVVGDTIHECYHR